MIYLDLDKDGLTGGLQLSIGDDSGGHRLAGPKYSGHSSRVQRKKLTAHDAEEIRAYLDKGCRRPRLAGPAGGSPVKCFACDRPIKPGRSRTADTRDAQLVEVGLDCYRRIVAAGGSGYQPPKGGPRLYVPEARP